MQNKVGKQQSKAKKSVYTKKTAMPLNLCEYISLFVCFFFVFPLYIYLYGMEYFFVNFEFCSISIYQFVDLMPFFYFELLFKIDGISSTANKTSSSSSCVLNLNETLYSSGATHYLISLNFSIQIDSAAKKRNTKLANQNSWRIRFRTVRFARN